MCLVEGSHQPVSDTKRKKGKKRKKHVVYTINTFVKNLMSIDMLEQMCAYCSSFILYFTTKSGMIISRALKDPWNLSTLLWCVVQAHMDSKLYFLLKTTEWGR